MPTPRSSTVAFASVEDMKSRFDMRVLCQLCSDTTTPLTEAQLDASDRLHTLLMDASGQVEAAAYVAGAYTPEDLAAMAGTVSGSHLVRLVCDLTLGMLWLARPDRQGEAPQSTEKAEEKLELLQKGKRVFGLLEQQRAGQMDDVIETAAVVEARRGVVVEMSRFFSRRVNRLGDGA